MTNWTDPLVSEADATRVLMDEANNAGPEESYDSADRPWSSPAQKTSPGTPEGK